MIWGKLRAMAIIVLMIASMVYFVGETVGSKPDWDECNGSRFIHSSWKDDAEVDTMGSARGWR